jgi:DNA-binding NarL/FixJ family response regulator
MHPADGPCELASAKRPVSKVRNQRSVRVVSPHPVIRAGVAGLLQPDSSVIVLTGDAADDATSVDVDVVIYDVFGLHIDRGIGLQQQVRAHPGRVLALSRVLQPGLTARALNLGAVAAISIEAEAEEFAAAVHAAAAGHLQDGSAADLANQRARQRHLGHDLDLTTREHQVLALIVTGAPNNDIAHQLYVSINTVKTLIRSAYKKIGVTTRSQAVAWGIEHGYPPDRPVSTGPSRPNPTIAGES